MDTGAEGATIAGTTAEAGATAGCSAVWVVTTLEATGTIGVEAAIGFGAASATASTCFDGAGVSAVLEDESEFASNEETPIAPANSKTISPPRTAGALGWLTMESLISPTCGHA
jgi:hypothetical protein